MMGKLIVSTAGWAIFAFVLIGTVRQYGVRWDFGPHGVNTLVADDGEHYRDGAAIDQITLAMHKSGCDGACCWVLLGVVGAGLAYLAYTVGGSHRQLARLRDSFRRVRGREQGEPPRD
jgi:hypothetical protein